MKSMLLANRRFCTPLTMMYMTDRMIPDKQTVSVGNTGDQVCAVALIARSDDATLFEIESLRGGMTLVGGVDYNPNDHNEIAIFSS